jgi:hypothetical protein
MMNSSATDARVDRWAWDIPKTRQCLRCQATFCSEWAGERICARCKSSATWRNGMPQRSYPASNRR